MGRARESVIVLNRGRVVASGFDSVRPTIRAVTRPAAAAHVKMSAEPAAGWLVTDDAGSRIFSAAGGKNVCAHI